MIVWAALAIALLDLALLILLGVLAVMVARKAKPLLAMFGGFGVPSVRASSATTTTNLPATMTVEPDRTEFPPPTHP